jgi:heme/copper-type cytochrome/quinol oxidase subunit 2
MLILVSVIALVPAILAATIGYVDTRRDARESNQSPYEEGERYLSRFGWVLNAVFTLIIFVESLPVFAYLGGC